MEFSPVANETDTRSPGTGLLARDGVAGDAMPWMGHLGWGPSHMLNDMGPATVVFTAEDIERQAAALTVQNAVERAIEKGEEYEYDE